jgi:hypothetical protein
MDRSGTLTWALAPPIPNALILTLSCRSCGHGVASTGTWSFACLNGTVLAVSYHKVICFGARGSTLGIRVVEFDIWRNGLLLKGENSLDARCDA